MSLLLRSLITCYWYCHWFLLLIAVTDYIHRTSADAPKWETQGCYYDNENPYLLFSSKTSYRTIYKDTVNVVPSPPGCEPIMVWSLIRHGARYTIRPEEFYQLYNIRDKIMYNFYNKRNVDLCEKDAENLRDWRFTMSDEEQNKIHESGLEESRSLAKRLREKFPEVLKPPYVPGQYMMLVTNTTSDKTLLSGQAFMESMFPNNPTVRVYPAIEDDLLVKVYKPCTNELLKQTASIKRKEIFNSVAYNTVIDSVSRRLGFSTLSPKDLNAMYKMCRFDKAWDYDKVSPWCAVFSESDLQVLEYFEDYKYYVKSGYGCEELSKKLGCPLLRDLIMRFKDLNDGKDKSQPSGLFYMAHSTTINTLLVAIEFARDSVPLTPHNYDEQLLRKWRSSLNGPFGANIIAVFYRCDNGDDKIAMYLNERPLRLKGCDDFMCSYKKFYQEFKDYVETSSCNVDRLCRPVYNVWFYLFWLPIVAGLIFLLKLLLQTPSVKRSRPYTAITTILRRPVDKKHMV